MARSNTYSGMGMYFRSRGFCLEKTLQCFHGLKYFQCQKENNPKGKQEYMRVTINLAWEQVFKFSAGHFSLGTVKC